MSVTRATVVKVLMDEPEAAQVVTTTSPGQPSQAATNAAAQAKRRDAAFSKFYRDFVPTLVAFLRFQGVPLLDAADIAQETMIRLYRAMGLRCAS